MRQVVCDDVIFGFNPLFIGEVSSTSTPATIAIAIAMFQSPLHRGSLFNVRLGLTQLERNAVSIPSSSGKSLQLSIKRGGCLGCFWFQSPLHRGSLFNGNQRSQAANEATVSIPSSSGKSLQRTFKMSLRTGKSQFHSPLHRGSLFNYKYDCIVSRSKCL